MHSFTARSILIMRESRGLYCHVLSMFTMVRMVAQHQP